MKVSPLFILTSESNIGPRPLVGPEVRIKKRWNLRNEPKCRLSTSLQDRARLDPRCSAS